MWHPVNFQNKTREKEETNTSCSADPSVGNNSTHSCGREWSCDYRRNSSTSRRRLSTVLRRVRLKTQLVGVTGRQNKTPDRAVTQRTRIQWKFGVKHWCSCSWVGSRLDHVFATNVLFQSLFGTGPRPPLQQGLGPVVWSAPECDGCVHTFPNELHHGG